MKTKQYLFILVLALPTLHARAQSGDILSQTLTWHSVSGYDSLAADSIHIQMKFTTLGNDRIENRNHKNVLQTFDITSTQGSWANVAEAGSILYHVTHNGVAGVIRIARTVQGTFLTVDFSGAGGIKMSFIINQVE